MSHRGIRIGEKLAHGEFVPGNLSLWVPFRTMSGAHLTTMAKPTSIFRPGVNCWRTAQTDRLAVLVDGKHYFDALVDVFDRARHRIVIVGWDFDSSIVLRPHDGLDVTLGQYLRSLVERTPTLEIYLAIWRGSLFYGESAELPHLLFSEWW